jgi:hypothetical protein
VLIPEVAQGAASELDDLRTACRTAIRRVMQPPVRILVIGAGPTSASYESSARGTLAGFGVDLEIPLGSDETGPVVLPLSLTVGAWVLRDALGPNCGAVGHSVGSDGIAPTTPEGSGPVALLVMGDGSARRSTSAPGYFDERAAKFDDGLADALRAGQRLGLQVDVQLGDELLATAPRAWAAAAPLLAEAPYRAELLYDDAPYGVGYFVAAWTHDA